MFNKFLIVGLGLIGGSILQGIIDNHLVGELYAVDFNKLVIKNSINDKLIQDGDDDLLMLANTGKLKDCECIIIAVPAFAIKNILAKIKTAIDNKLLPDDVIISDTASTKGNILKDAFDVFGVLPSNLVLAHPIAGAEKSGFMARDGNLFKAHKLIICPHEFNNQITVDKISTLWQALGAKVDFVSCDKHDEILALTSHLPHLLSYVLTYQLAKDDENLNIFRYAAGGFRDFSRIAASDPIMWHDIFLANKTAILQAIDDYERHLSELKQFIIDDNSPQIIRQLTDARHARRHFGHMLNQNKNMDNIMKQTFIIQPSHTFTGTHKVAPDKSISHRCIMFGSLANGVTKVSNFLEGEDALSTLQAFCDMGVKIERNDDKVVIHGVGMNGLKAPSKPLDMGNSGTSMRLLSGILSAQPFDSVMMGDVSLSKRPMERVAKPLRQMGAVIQTTGKKGTPPITITGGQSLQAIDYVMPMASAQVKSCLLLAGLWADGTTSIIEPESTRDHTERMLRAFGYTVVVDKQPHGNKISITGGGQLTACDITVPADISSAAFFMVAATIANHGNITIKQVGINPTRTGVIDILKLMGADICLANETMMGGEPVADIMVKSSKLKGINIPAHLVPLAIDEFPVLFVAASCATGKTILRGAKELRVKESDRIAVMADGLKTLGIDCTVLDDGIEIIGKGDEHQHGKRVFTGGKIDSHHDHRIAMSFTVASLQASDAIIIHGTETVNTSFPNFAQLVNEAGLHVNVKNDVI